MLKEFGMLFLTITSVAISLLVAVFIIASILVALGVELPSEKYFKQCIADGVKEYECYSMVYGRHK